jgi:hypothetical protein|tara:strand:+ start:10 stop:543 length:534 start_codon:yes stop_codon:yes gene_type:complete
MKNLKLILLAIVVSLAGVSCSSDDDNNDDNGSSSNSMNIEGVESDISAAVLIEYGENEDGSYDWDVVLLGEGLTVNNQDLDGSGATLYLDLNTNNPDGLRAGTYTFSPNYEREEFTWVAIEGCQNSDGLDCQSGISQGQDGTVVITGSGSNTTIEVIVTDTDGDNISANYTGGFISL